MAVVLSTDEDGVVLGWIGHKTLDKTKDSLLLLLRRASRSIALAHSASANAD